MDLMDIKDDIKQILLERLKSPIINFYLFFLVLYNWDLILMLFFLNGDVNSKILELKNAYDEKKMFWILNWRFISPMIYAFLSIVLFPFISNFIDNLLKPITKKRIENFYEIEEVKADKDLIVINKRTGNKTLETLDVELKTEKEKTESLLNDLNNTTNELNQIKAKELLNSLKIKEYIYFYFQELLKDFESLFFNNDIKYEPGDFINDFKVIFNFIMKNPDLVFKYDDLKHYSLKARNFHLKEDFDLYFDFLSQRMLIEYTELDEVNRENNGWKLSEKGIDFYENFLTRGNFWDN